VEADDLGALHVALVPLDEMDKMQRLNIPLERQTRTTRPTRRVVWLLMGGLLLGACTVAQLGMMWFGRGTILKLAPSDTILAIELRLDEHSAPFLFDWLAGVPLISDRSLDLIDLAPYIHGEFAVFLTKSGDRTVAFRAKKDNLSEEMLNTYSISIQEKGNFILLSSSLVPISGVEDVSARPFFPQIKQKWLGRILFPDTGMQGNLLLSQQDLVVSLKTPQASQSELPNIDSALAFGGLTWGSDGSPIVGLERFASRLSESENTLFLDNSNEIEVFIRPNETSKDVLMVLHRNETEATELLEELRYFGALAKPSLVTQVLQDGSSMDEILVQPELVSVEEVATSVGSSFRVPIMGGGFAIASIHNGSVLLSNSEMLIEEYISSNTLAQDSCSVSGTHLFPDFLIQEIHVARSDKRLSVLDSLFNNFSSISIEFKKYSTDVHFCRI
jgi:hypothetical protein